MSRKELFLKKLRNFKLKKSKKFLNKKDKKNKSLSKSKKLAIKSKKKINQKNLKTYKTICHQFNLIDKLAKIFYLNSQNTKKSNWKINSKNSLRLQ
jgi:hypothetical protein